MDKFDILMLVLLEHCNRSNEWIPVVTCEVMGWHLIKVEVWDSNIISSQPKANIKKQARPTHSLPVTWTEDRALVP